MGIHPSYEHEAATTYNCPVSQGWELEVEVDRRVDRICMQVECVLGKERREDVCEGKWMWLSLQGKQNA